MKIHLVYSGAILLLLFTLADCTYKNIELISPVASTCYLTSISYDGGSSAYIYVNNYLFGTDGQGDAGRTIVFDQQNRLRFVVVHARIDSFFYDTDSRLSKKITSYDSGKHVGEVQTFSYNLSGQLKLSTDANYSIGSASPASADTTSYEYPDTATPNYSQTTTWGTSGGPAFSTYTYDNKNNPFWGVDPRGNTTNVTSWTTSGGWNHTETYHYTYNEFGYPSTKSGINSNNNPWKQYYSYTNCTFK